MPLLICLRNISENFDIGVEKTESDLDNRTGRLQRMLHSPCFLADHTQKHLMDLPVAVEFRMESNCDLISIAYTDDMVIDY